MLHIGTEHLIWVVRSMIRCSTLKGLGRPSPTDYAVIASQKAGAQRKENSQGESNERSANAIGILLRVPA